MTAKTKFNVGDIIGNKDASCLGKISAILVKFSGNPVVASIQYEVKLYHHTYGIYETDALEYKPVREKNDKQ